MPLLCKELTSVASLLFGFTHDVTFFLQRKQNYAARVTLRIPKSANKTKSLYIHIAFLFMMVPLFMNSALFINVHC